MLKYPGNENVTDPRTGQVRDPANLYTWSIGGEYTSGTNILGLVFFAGDHAAQRMSHEGSQWGPINIPQIEMLPSPPKFSKKMKKYKIMLRYEVRLSSNVVLTKLDIYNFLRTMCSSCSLPH